MSDLEQRRKHLVPDLSKPSAKGLAYLLRHQELWPKDFGPWNYGNLGGCGMGLALAQWQDQINLVSFGYSVSVADAIGISHKAGYDIFVYGSGDYPGAALMPEQMASMLEQEVHEREMPAPAPA